VWEKEKVWETERKKDSVERARARDCEFVCVLFDFFQLFWYQLFAKMGMEIWSFVVAPGLLFVPQEELLK
jgi:hypothetical protein